MQNSRGIATLLALLTVCLLVSGAKAQADPRCAMFDSAFEHGTVTDIHLYGDRHGMIVYVVGCPEVNVGVRFGPDVTGDPANAEFLAYYIRESVTSRRSATLDVVADFDPAMADTLGPRRMLTIQKILHADLSQERNIRLLDEPGFGA